MGCALTGLAIVYGGYHSPWAYECLDGWLQAGLCLLGYLTVSRMIPERAYQEAFMLQELLPLAGPHFPG